jgi:Spy/CpxP family protein refolding chaperone
MSSCGRRIAMAIIAALFVVPAVTLANKAATTEPSGKHHHRHHRHHKGGSTTRPSKGTGA